jgi:hypothetical protein
MRCYLKVRIVIDQGNAQVIKFIICIGQVDCVPHLGPGLTEKIQENNNGQDPDKSFGVFP